MTLYIRLKVISEKADLGSKVNHKTPDMKD